MLIFALAVAAAPAPTLPVQPAHAGVRAALLLPRAGDAADIDAAIDAAFARDAGASALAGFALRRLEGRDPAAACARARSLATTPGPLQLLALPRHLRCAADAGGADATDALPLASQALAGPFANDPGVVRSVARLVAAHPSLDADAVDKALAPLLSVPVPTHEPARRAAVAAGLVILATRGSPPLRARAAERLLDELPEQPADGVVDPGAALPARRVRRAMTLDRLQRNEDVTTLLSDLVPQDCEAALLVAKAERKLRHYAAARRAVAAAVAPRCGETRKKAQYLDIRLATLSRAASSEKLVAAFVDTWPGDPLVDDTLLWLSEVRAARGDVAGRDEALERLLALQPDGDMADEARFRLALSLAVQGKTDQAQTLLAAAEEALQKQQAPKPIDLDRARYWRARLTMFPDPRTLDAVEDADRRAAGTAALAAFARSRGASFYGHLARRLLRTRDPSITLAAPGARRESLAADAVVTVPPALAGDPRFALALRALEHGFDDEAAVLLNDVVADPAVAIDRTAVTAVAAAFVTAGRPDRAHQALRNAGQAMLPDLPEGNALAAWTLSWPRAHAAVLQAAATAHEVPVPLLQGLAREESAFDANVVSWAGAVGLCQLMPPTAADEARALKLPPPTTTALLDPALNATLGAAHLGRRLRGMSHPLLAIGAYNAGPGAVLRWLPARGGRIPLDLFIEEIPVEETRNYIKKVTGSWVTYAVLDGGGDVDKGPLAFSVWIAR